MGPFHQVLSIETLRLVRTTSCSSEWTEKDEWRETNGVTNGRKSEHYQDCIVFMLLLLAKEDGRKHHNQVNQVF